MAYIEFDPGSGMETVRPRLNTDQAIYFILFISFYGRSFPTYYLIIK